MQISSTLGGISGAPNLGDISTFYQMELMIEIGIAEYFGMAEALGIIAAVFVVVYYSRKQMQALSIDIETKILNDLDEKLNGITQIGVQQPELIKVLSNVKSD